MVASPLLSVAPQFGPQVSDKRLETCLQTRNGNPHSRVWAPTQELVLRRYFLTAAACTSGWTTPPRRSGVSPMCCSTSPSVLGLRVSSPSFFYVFNFFFPFWVFSGLIFLGWSSFLGLRRVPGNFLPDVIIGARVSRRVGFFGYAHYACSANKSSDEEKCYVVVMHSTRYCVVAEGFTLFPAVFQLLVRFRPEGLGQAAGLLGYGLRHIVFLFTCKVLLRAQN